MTLQHGFNLVKPKPEEAIYISEGKLQEIFSNPDGPLNPLGQFVFYSKYSRWRDDLKRREYWAETTQRATEYNANLAIGHLREKGLLTKQQIDYHQKDLDALANNQFYLKQALSGRTLWTGGTTPSYENPMSNFNCSFMVIDEWRKLGELIHLGMVGSGIGFRILEADVSKLKPITTTNWKITHKEYNGLPKEERNEETQVIQYAKGVIEIVIGDSKEGWRQSIDTLFHWLTNAIEVNEIIFNYDSIRPSGEQLKTFGGRAGGPESIKGMFDTFHKILNGKLEENYPKVVSGAVEPIHVLDLANAIGKNIVSGDVRSIAEIALLDQKNDKTISAKDDIFTKESLYHRFVSNNSIFYEEKPTKERLDWQFDKIRYNGEPCFFNAVVARERRPNADGTNPCVEIILADRGLCNLTTVNVFGFVEDGTLNYNKLYEAFRLATRAGLRMTLPRLEIDEWDLTQQRDRLLGVSMTGYQDAIDAIGKHEDTRFQRRLLTRLKSVVRKEADRYAIQLGVNAPLLTTCVKPEGTQSLLFGGVSSGLHVSHAPNYLRRIRASAQDPISKAVFDLGWKISAEYADGSQKKEIAHVMQFVSGVESEQNSPDGIQPIAYEFFKGSLKVETKVDLKEDYGDIESELKEKLSMWYDQEINPEVEIDGNTALIKYKVDFGEDSFDKVFGHTKKIVVEFPVSRPVVRHRDNWGAIKQLEMYKLFLEAYTEHNPSNTITVRDEEWEDVKKWVYDNWDSTLAMSFLAHTDIVYPLLPYQTTTEEEVNELKAEMKPFDASILMKYDNGNDMELVESDCVGGVCPVR